nr:MAG TPA: hypothetical protein [Caudoviricetes sp.]
MEASELFFFLPVQEMLSYTRSFHDLDEKSTGEVSQPCAIARHPSQFFSRSIHQPLRPMCNIQARSIHNTGTVHNIFLSYPNKFLPVHRRADIFQFSPPTHMIAPLMRQSAPLISTLSHIP